MDRGGWQAAVHGVTKESDLATKQQQTIKKTPGHTKEPIRVFALAGGVAAERLLCGLQRRKAASAFPSQGPFPGRELLTTSPREC